MKEDELLLAARRAADAAYAPYSRFRVGAALLCDDGRVVTGCNVENAFYGLSICAERVAVFAAIALGARHFRALALSCPDGQPRQPVVPCGACRQVLAEFAEKKLGRFGKRRSYYVG
jgi:cytidine deaminase